MRKAILAFAFIFIISTVSCGRTVRKTGNNDTGESIPTEPETLIAQEITEEVTEPPTDPPTEPYKVKTQMPDDYELSGSYVIDGFETVLQKPELPTGCEITALTQTLNFYGFDVDKVTMADRYMPVDFDGYYTMDDVYLGDPHSYNGFGCNAPVIKQAADDYFTCIGSDWYALDLTGISMKDVFYHIEQGRPVVVWSTIEQRETHSSFQFQLGCGEDFYFNNYQHCLTIYGYDYEEGMVHIADPLVGNVKYDMERFERIYDTMGNQAVILCGYPDVAGVEFTDKEEQEKWMEENTPNKPARLDHLPQPTKGNEND